MRRYLWLWGILFSALLVACAGEPTAEPLVVADLFATPGKALATIALSPTPSPTPTIPHFPSPTPQPTLPLPTSIARQPTLPLGTPGSTIPGVSTPTPEPVNCDTSSATPFQAIWASNGMAQQLLRCPLGEPQDVAVVYQVYQHGYMFWRESDQSIFVLSESAIRQGQPTDTWWRVLDTFREGELESDPALTPPNGLLQPVRGFGKVWRENAFIREALGWATSQERYYTSQWQFFEEGWMITGPDGHPVFVMLPSDEPPYTYGVHLGALLP